MNNKKRSLKETVIIFINDRILILKRKLRPFPTNKFVSKKSRSNFPIKLKFLPVLVLSIVLIFVIFNLVQYYQIQLQDFSSNGSAQVFASRNKISGVATEVNTLFIGLDNRKDDLKFISLAGLISYSYQTGEVKTYALNTNYLVRKGNLKLPLRSIYNFSTGSDLSKIQEITEIFEAFYAIRIDKYIVINISSLEDFIKNLNISITLDQSYLIDNSYLPEGDKLSPENFVKFLQESPSSKDELMNLQAIFFKDVVESLRSGIIGLYFKFINLDNVTTLFSSNFSRDEFLRLAINLSNSSNFITPKFISSKLTLDSIENLNIESGVQGSDILIDEELSKSFRNISVVKEQAKIEIFNATDISGVAYNLKRKLENIGMTVIKTGNYPEKVTENTLFVPNKNSTNFLNSIKAISATLRDDLKIVIGEYKFNYSGDLILVIANTK